VRYEAVNAMLLNEFLKGHRKVEALQEGLRQQHQEFQVALAQQEKEFHESTSRQQVEIETLTAALKVQSAQIQKVSDRLEVSKPAPQVVVSNR
jgi:hypothetical protein